MHEILNKLNDIEVEKLQNFRTKGKEKEVYNYLLKTRKKKLQSSVSIAKSIDISSNHYHKINSVLISKLFCHLFGNDKIQLLNWLKCHSLYSILKTELKNICKEFTFTTAKNNNSKFYLSCFHACLDLPFSEYDISLSNSLGNIYLKSLVSATEADEWYVKCHLLFADCNRASASRNPIKNFSFNLEYFNKELDYLKNKKFFLALFYLNRTFVSYYTYYVMDAKKALFYLEKAIEIQDEVSEFFLIDIKQFLQLNYADILLDSNKYQEAFQKYTSIFNSGVSSEMYGIYYHLEMYIISAICTKHYKIAEGLYLKYFESTLNPDDMLNFLRGILCKAKLTLALQDYKATLRSINIARNINDKTSYLPFDLQLRVIENVTFLLKKDYEFAKQLAYRNIKFIQGLPAKKRYEKTVSLYKSISNIVLAKNKNKKLSNNLINVIKSSEEWVVPIYGNIINDILAENI